MCFFFHAEDGIRDYKVTGVQTCALPICGFGDPVFRDLRRSQAAQMRPTVNSRRPENSQNGERHKPLPGRSEERRVGKECRSRSTPDNKKRKKRTEKE